MDADSLFKLPVLALLYLLRSWNSNPPGSTPSESERKGYEKAGDTVPSFMLRWGRFMYKDMMDIILLIEGYVVLSKHYPEITNEKILSIIAPSCQGSSQGPRITNTFLTGAFLVTVGTLLRLWCYRLLGQNFTFHLAIRNKHELCTRGPYKVVRHPSYTGATLSTVGHVLCSLGSGSWWAECGRETLLGWALVMVFAGWLFVLVPAMFRRTRVEDKVLHEVFGKQWAQWAKKTPYAIIPYVF